MCHNVTGKGGFRPGYALGRRRGLCAEREAFSPQNGVKVVNVREGGYPGSEPTFLPKGVNPG